ncbi:hypothetical protein EMIHUDRAFT_220246 [Emiliania huxleyi CCMP1516]|uniref:AP2/ERF domain-containing protein n=2 Tax=Emiliania huxleyi TaxID=2903 RepID=A0A0D3I1K9_EMIH1|nr:hypothetical protein EMIHUDRAFT_220246 [Emiliania huxleyi CCMP1516]EOD05144.1 hypothetical protein EMIHUDRAFT_220246 [Emiliania huxleyi CCMP1516]|eukprot:XP_005757573.1 hypothetical protein EMIHUDRAFT_220246 [Emiliania huxleyi CCMP1516]
MCWAASARAAAARASLGSDIQEEDIEEDIEEEQSRRADKWSRFKLYGGVIASHERWLRCLAACERLDAEMDDPDGVKHREATRFIAVSQFASGAWLDLCPDGRHSSKITSEYVYDAKEAAGETVTIGMRKGDQLANGSKDIPCEHKAHNIRHNGTMYAAANMVRARACGKLVLGDKANPQTTFHLNEGHVTDMCEIGGNLQSQLDVQNEVKVPSTLTKTRAGRLGRAWRHTADAGPHVHATGKGWVKEHKGQQSWPVPLWICPTHKMNTHRLMLWFRVRNLRIFSFENSTEYFNAPALPCTIQIESQLLNSRNSTCVRCMMAPPRTASSEGVMLIPATKNSTTGYKNVSYKRSKNKFQAQVQDGGKCVRLGSFDTAEEAATAYAQSEYGRADAAKLLQPRPAPTPAGAEAIRQAEREGLTLTASSSSNTGYKGVCYRQKHQGSQKYELKVRDGCKQVFGDRLMIMQQP